MKNLILSILTFSFVLFFTVDSQAQYLTVGGGVGYSTESEQVNFTVNAAYKLPGLPMRLGGAVDYTIEDKTGNVRNSAIDGNINTYLMAVDTQLVSVYGLTGLNVYHQMVKIDSPSGSISESDTSLGLNLGGGAEVQQGPTRFYAEMKYIFREDDARTVVSAGMRFRF